LEPMEHENVLRWFQDTAERRGAESCFRYKKDKIWRTLTWSEVLSRVAILSEALKKIGVVSGDRVSILSNTRYEWTLYDIAITSIGAVTVPIYQSNISEDVQHILSDSGTKAILVEDSTQLEKVLKVRSQLPQLKQIILLEGEVMGDGVITHADFEATGKGVESDFGARIRSIKIDQLATLVYTSGTTGKPKGVMLTHENLLAEVRALIDRVKVEVNDTMLIFLPLAHILARVVQWYQLTLGFENAYAESVEKLGENISDIRPHVMVCVPRIFEKIHTGMMSQVEAGSDVKKKIFNFAKETGLAYSYCLQNKQPIPLGLKIKYGIASKLVFSKLQKKLGGRIKFFVSGGAPLSREICEFFHGAGVLILEGYGLTETTAATNANGVHDYVFGSVGKPVLGAEEKIAEDGEILVRGPMVAKGYWNRPEATAEVFEKNGWFHTGDIGEFDKNGFLKITDRKKDIIVTAGGKNIAPQNLENMIKTNPLISQVVVHGDKRKYLSALITLNPEEVAKKARELGIPKGRVEEQTNDPKMKDAVKRIIDNFNNRLASYESIKKFAILDKDFSIESGELTPTLKVKRKVINERYGKIFDSFYE
jgi:long-chain acyl-CoA synthetase